MGRWWRGCVAGGLGAVAVGCHTIEHDTSVPLVEEWKAPPSEDRFNNPPEQGYRKPAPKKEFKPGLGGPNGPGGGGGGMMGGGQGF